ncbi:MAG: hypothetical protein ACRD5L_03130, partial [Bryobacteraceae bacterium]
MWNQVIGFVKQNAWALFAVEVAGMLAGAHIFRKFLIGWLRRWTKRTTTTVDDQLLTLADKALLPCLLLGVTDAALNLLPLSRRLLVVLNRGLYIFVLLFALYYGTRAIQVLLDHWLMKHEGSEAMRE